MLLAVTGSSRPHKICYLDISYLIKHSSDYTFHFNKLTKTSSKDNLVSLIKYLNFTCNKNLCACDHIDQYIEKTQKDSKWRK